MMKMIESELLELAEHVARQAHNDQTDKSGLPYIEHCKRVADGVVGERAKVVAWLHDVLEDTHVTESDLRALFSDEIVDAVVALTHPDREPNATYWCRIRSIDLARQVKLSDIVDNSNPARLSTLDHKTVVRLVTKYKKALRTIL